MKRLLYIFPTLNPGGAEKAAIQIANYLVEKKSYDITFFVYDDSDYYHSLVNKSIKIIQYGHRHRHSSKFFWWYYFYFDFGFRLFTKTSQEDYDFIVAIHEQVPEIALCWVWGLHWLLGDNIKFKLVTVVQTSLVGIHSSRHEIASRMLFGVLKYLRRYTFNTIVVLSKEMSHSLRNSHRNILIIPNPVDFYLLEQNKNLVHNSIPGQKAYLLFVARIAPQKNPFLLLKAYESIYTKINYNLIIIGYVSDGLLYVKINNFIREMNLKERISILGTVDNPYSFIVNAKGVILVSNYEGLPMVLLEAMALKVPIITTKYEGYDEYFDDTIATLVERNSVEELSATLLQFESEYPKFKKKTEKAFQYSKKFDIKNIGEKYHKLFIGEKE